MEVRSCRKCKQIFESISASSMCAKCSTEEEAIFQVVKDYVRENKGATIDEVSGVTGVSQRRIRQYLKEGRLAVAPDSPITLYCEKCKMKIRTGRLCERCRTKLNNGLSDAAKKIHSSHLVVEERPKARMRFLDAHNK